MVFKEDYRKQLVKQILSIERTPQYKLIMQLFIYAMNGRVCGSYMWKARSLCATWWQSPRWRAHLGKF